MKWIRPSGTTLETNDREVTIKYCESLGFKRADAPKEVPKKKSAKKAD